MSKPDNIPQDAWEAGQAVMMASRLFMIATDDFDEHSALIARAIIAEREACAVLAASEADGMPSYSDFGEGYNKACSDVADAIRKRGA